MIQIIKKTILLFIIFIASNLAHAQQEKNTGVVRDAVTLQPIEYVNIYVGNNADYNPTGAISNELGEFSINFYDGEVIFSHINYERLSIKLAEKNNEIKLTPKTYILDEIIISTVSEKDYLRGLIDNSIEKLHKNTVYQSYCREIVTIHDKITKYSDALADFFIKKKNGKAKVFLKQHRALKIKDSDLASETDGSMNSIYSLKDYVKDAYRFNILKRIVKIEGYELERKLKREKDGTEYELINIIPDSKSKEALMEGYIIVNPKNNVILEYKLYTSKKHEANAKLINILIAKFKIKKRLVWSKFRILNNHPVLIYNKEFIDVFIKIGKWKEDFSFTSDFFVYDYQRNVKIPKNTYKKHTIFEAGTKYYENFWTKYNSFPLTKVQQNFVDSTEEQYNIE